MRPVQRGISFRRVRDYTTERENLVGRLGDYCSYCERPTSHAIEHVLPWEPTVGAPIRHPRLENSWTNFLLTCTKCNIYKARRQDSTPYGQRRLARARYYWPDTDNTARAFEYHPTGDVTVSTDRTAVEQAIAGSTLRLFGFEKAADIRKNKRAGVWSAAKLHLNSWVRCPTDDNLETIAVSAREAGCWSVWRTVFAAHPRVLMRLNQVFPGTCRSCFDPNTSAPRQRSKGRL